MSRSVTPARSAAFRILQETAKGTTDPASLLHRREVTKLRPSDRDLATELVYGVLRWQNRLDFIIEVHAERRVKEIDLPLLLALRIGLYQIRFLSRIPERAAVDESVKLARAFGPRGTSGFVNAVLRAVCRRPDVPLLPSPSGDPIEYLSVTLSHPRWLARRYLHRLGFPRSEARCIYQNRTPPIDLRVEPRVTVDEARDALAKDNVSTEIHPLVPRCLRVGSGRPAAGALHRPGAVFIQEAGSQLIPYLLDVQAGDRVLDACAAPGAKTTEMSPWVRPGKVIAMEKRRRRLALMASLARKLKCDNVIAVGADAEYPPFRATFRRILLDAPCSSLGTLARNPDIKWRLEERDLSGYADRQYRLLSSCARMLAPGGRIVYATCSTEPEENEEVLERFLQSHPGFAPTRHFRTIPDAARRLLDDRGILRTFPENDATDGYFAVALEHRHPRTG